MASNDIKRAENYFRRSKDTGDEKNMSRGLMHLIKFLGMTEGRDFKRATELLDVAWKKGGKVGTKKTAEAMFLVARELSKGTRTKRVTSGVDRDDFGIIKALHEDEDEEDEA
jgi:hypothetical protein